MKINEELSMQVSLSKDSHGNIIMRPVDRDIEKAELLFIKLRATGHAIATIVVDDNQVSIKSRKLERMYRASLSRLAEAISDVVTKWTPESLHLYFKEQFCRFKKDMGVDLYEKYNREVDGRIVELERPISFDKKVDGKIYKEYVLDFYKNHCITQFNINPFEDLEERQFITQKLKEKEQ